MRLALYNTDFNSNREREKRKISFFSREGLNTDIFLNRSSESFQLFNDELHWPATEAQNLCTLPIISCVSALVSFLNGIGHLDTEMFSSLSVTYSGNSACCSLLIKPRCEETKLADKSSRKQIVEMVAENARKHLDTCMPQCFDNIRGGRYILKREAMREGKLNFFESALANAICRAACDLSETINSAEEKEVAKRIKR